MPGVELEPIGRSDPVLPEVAAEMSEIFARAGVSQPVAGPRRPAAVAALRPSRGNGQTTTLLAAAAAGLVGLGAGAFVIRTPSAPAQAEAQARLAAQPRPQLQAQLGQQPKAPPVALAEAAPAPAVVETAPVQARPAARTSATLARVARTRSHSRIRVASAKPPIRMSEPVPMAQSASCEQDAEGDNCRGAVIQADRHLRAVYESAIRRGVSRGVLVDYRDRWADLRDRHTDDPTRLIQSYGALAYDLGREGAADEDDAPRSHGRSGLKALADLLLPWR